MFPDTNSIHKYTHTKTLNPYLRSIVLLEWLKILLDYSRNLNNLRRGVWKRWINIKEMTVDWYIFYYFFYL